ncbi:hypothetical protein M3Y96_01054700 [Aphelenchoides besseyi]|nr:hypothetical protein M3Y96_01054700 [Aphelenchoides besseyi]
MSAKKRLREISVGPESSNRWSAVQFKKEIPLKFERRRQRPHASDSDTPGPLRIEVKRPKLYVLQDQTTSSSRSSIAVIGSVMEESAIGESVEVDENDSKSQFVDLTNENLYWNVRNLKGLIHQQQMVLLKDHIHSSNCTRS